MRDPRLDALNLEKIPHVRFVIAVSDHPGHGREQAARLPGLRNAGQAHRAGRAAYGGSPYPPSTMLDSRGGDRDEEHEESNPNFVRPAHVVLLSTQDRYQVS